MQLLPRALELPRVYWCLCSRDWQWTPSRGLASWYPSLCSRDQKQDPGPPSRVLTLLQFLRWRVCRCISCYTRSSQRSVELKCCNTHLSFHKIELLPECLKLRIGSIFVLLAPCNAAKSSRHRVSCQWTVNRDTIPHDSLSRCACLLSRNQFLPFFDNSITDGTWKRRLRFGDNGCRRFDLGCRSCVQYTIQHQ